MGAVDGVVYTKVDREGLNRPDSSDTWASAAGWGQTPAGYGVYE